MSLTDAGNERKTAEPWVVRYGEETGPWAGIADQVGGPCPDCGTTKGEPHKPGCDVERCPFCGGQRVSCPCPAEIDRLLGWGGYPRLDVWEHIAEDDIWNWDAWMAYGRRVMARARELGWVSVGWTTICDPPMPSGVPPERANVPGDEIGVVALPDLLKEPRP